jgi:hypothetical protein
MKSAIPIVVAGLIFGIAGTVSAQNAAPLYEKALASLPTTPSDVEAYKNWQFAKIDTATLDLVRRCQASRQLLHQAALAPTCDWGWDYKKGPELQLPELKGVRPLSLAAALWIRVSFEQKHEVEAMEAVEDLVLMGHRLTIAPLMITGLMGRALEATATYVAAAYLPTLTQPSLQKLGSFIEALPADTGISQSLQKEQAVVIDLLAEAAMTGGHKTFAADMPKQPGEAGRAISVSRELANEAVRIASLPPDQAIATGAAYKAKVAAAPAVCQKTAIGEPEHLAMTEAHHRVNMALFKAAILVVRNGPAAVKSISDPAGSGPFSYRKIPDGFELSSKLIDRGEAVSLQVGPEALR